MNPRSPIPDGCFRGVVGVSRVEITPPAGIYSRCWGASTHDTAAGVHRPLTLTTLTIERHRLDQPLILMSADLMSWRSRDAEKSVLGGILNQLTTSSWGAERLMFCLTHTHSAPSIRQEDADKPGGHLIAEYQQQLVKQALQSVRLAQVSKANATIDFRYGRCDLAANRDLPDPDRNRIVCGFNPETSADDTLLVGRVCDDAGKIIATIVNYACHPTTLAWENQLISPDWVGAMRETVESHTNAPCLFLQGASGELAPAEQYVGDTEIAERHGRRVGFAVLSTLEGMDPPGTGLEYQGVVESGAPLAMWKRQSVALSNVRIAKQIDVELPLKPMPTLDEIDAERRQCADPVMKERLWRQRGIRTIVGDGTIAKMPLYAWRIGDAAFIGQPNETYSAFQTELRQRFAARRIAVMNLVNGSLGYLAPRDRYASDIYQVWQSPFAEGSLEILLSAAENLLHDLFTGHADGPQ